MKKKREMVHHLKNVSLFVVLCMILTFLYHHSRTKWRDVININLPSQDFGLFNELEEKQNGFFSSDNPFDVDFKITTTNIDKDLQQKKNLVTSGEEFTGQKIRRYPINEMIFNGKSFSKISGEDQKILDDDRHYHCDKWGVMTTIFYPPSEAVRRFMYRKEWCVVIVGDKGRPSRENYNVKSTLGERVIFLTEDDQINMKLEFVDHLPWNSFGRKNIGYLFAISQGAKIIFDFDDDNIIKFWIKDASIDPVMDIDNFNENGGLYLSNTVYEPKISRDEMSFNPYPLLGAPSLPCWPRGMPLSMIQCKKCREYEEQNIHLYQNESSTNTIKANFAVLQSVADIQPDVDAIYRLTRETPFSFIRPEPMTAPIIRRVTKKQAVKSRAILKVPADTMTPYNAQATMFFQSGFWSLFLPVTVAGRVSDIWRSYFSQALFKRIAVDLGFFPRPLVVQDRNPHSYGADFNAEIPLYTKSYALVSYLLKSYVLNDKQFNQQSFIEALEFLWIDMYERGYIEKDDVSHLQRWITTLHKIGYQFPDISFPSSEIDRESSQENIYYNLTDILQIRKKIRQLGHRISDYNKDNDNSKCDSSKYNVVFGSSDVHNGPKMDISSVLANMNQTYVYIGKKPSENYPEITSLPQIKQYHIKDSYPLRVYNDHSTKMSPNWPSMNTKWYKKRNLDKKIDAFICSFPASMCQLWIPMNKSIIFLPAHRYNLGRCSVNEWRKLDEDILELNKSSSNQGHSIGAVSRYDVEYIRYYTGIQATLVPSFGGFYYNSSLYVGNKNEILVFSYPPKSKFFLKKVQESLLPEYSAVQVYDIYPKYTPEKLGQHRAVITLPYSVMSYRTTELYALGMPLFVPSIKFYSNYNGLGNNSTDFKSTDNWLGLGWDRTSTSHPYCSADPKLELQMRPKPGSTKSIHPYSPNLDIFEDAESENYWLQFADFYDWPHIQYFDDYHHLKKLILNTNFTKVHNDMKQELIIKRDIVLDTWCNVIKNVEKSKIHDL